MKSQKTALVTGGTGGIGFECARTLAAAGWHVVVTARDPAKGKAAVAAIGGSAEALPLDLASLASVRAFAAAFPARSRPPLHAVVCNAGTMALKGVTHTKDGFEENFGVNHLGHFLLVHLLLPHLASPGRVAVVSSSGHDPKTMAGRSNPPKYLGADRLARPGPGDVKAMTGLARYGTSKLCNLLFAYELDRRLRAAERSDVTVNGYDPGAVLGTGLGRDLGLLYRVLLSQPWLLRLLGGRVVSQPDAGAGLARLVLDPTLDGVSGRYFEVLDERPSSAESHDREKARDLWETSRALVGLPAVELGREPERTSAVPTVV